MARILLISTNRCTAPDPVFPLGLAYLNGALRRAGHETNWIDFQQQSQPLEETLAVFRPDLIGLSLRNIDDVLIKKRETFFNELLSTCQTVRNQTANPIVLGGSGFSIFPKVLLARTTADFGICGEGETGLISLIQALETRTDYSRVPGLVFRRGRDVVQNPGRPESFDLSLELADRPSEIVPHYLRTSGMLNVQTQRGCPLHCCYCTYPLIESKRCRRRPPEAIADELEQIQQLGARYVFVVDSVFNSSPAHVAETCEAIARRNLQIRWGCFLRPRGLSTELMRLMVRAGLAHIEFGSDSFCDEVLERYQKGFTFADILKSSALAREHNVDYCHFLICGGPGESLQTLENAFENSRRLKDAVIMAVVGMRIYPGTNLFHQALKEGRIYSETDLLNPVYYLASGLTADMVFNRLREFARSSPNWIIGDPSPGYANLVARLRQRGTVGPLWSYVSMLQRLWPGKT